MTFLAYLWLACFLAGPVGMLVYPVVTNLDIGMHKFPPVTIKDRPETTKKTKRILNPDGTIQIGPKI